MASFASSATTGGARLDQYNFWFSVPHFFQCGSSGMPAVPATIIVSAILCNKKKFPTQFFGKNNFDPILIDR